MTRKIFAVLILGIGLVVPGVAQDFDPDEMATFSIVARDPETGELGECVTSKALAGGDGGLTVKGGVGVIAHQASRDPMYGKLGILLLEMGMSPTEALEFMQRADRTPERRQIGIIDIEGRTAVYTNGGASSGPTGAWRGHRCGVDYCAQGNSLTGPEVIEAVANSFESSTGPLAERLMAAIDAGQAAGGDARGKQTAVLIVAKPMASRNGWSDRVVDFRVDDHPEPMRELRRIYNKKVSGDMIRQGNGMISDGDVRGGLEVLIDASELSPDNDNAWVAVASAYLRNDRRADAFDALRKAVELNPNNRVRLPNNQNFASVVDDPEFRRIVGN